MQLSRTAMLDRARARDRSFDGRFLTCVTSTGIYCLPSCPARTPKPENVVHHATPAEAEAAGFRACLRCRPDDFYRGYDADEELAAGIAREVVAEPARFRDAPSIAARAGVGITKLHALFRDHFHTTPADFLARARVAFACSSLRDGRRALDASLDAGFDSSSAFYANFAPRTGMTPDAYRKLGARDAFTLALPDDFRAADWLAIAARDPESACERATDSGLVKALDLLGAPALLAIDVARGKARCTLTTRAPDEALRYAAHAAAFALLDLDREPRAFEQKIARTRLGKIVRRRSGLRLSRTASPFEALAWAVVGQQVNLAFAASLRRRVVLRAGTPIDGLRTHPTAAQVAALDPADLHAQQFSRSKADYLIGAASAVARGELALDHDLAEPATRIRRRLVAQRGLGAWSATYLLMRGFGFGDCAPVGDSGLQTALQRAFALDARPGEQDSDALLKRFAPWRSLATQHLWRSLSDDDTD